VIAEVDPIPAIERRGSARRAFRGYLATVAAGVPLGSALLWLCAQYVPNSEWDDLGFVIYGMLTIVFGFGVLLPIAAFTLGRWLDVRTARASEREAAVRFGVAGMILALVPLGLAFGQLFHSVAAIAFFPVLGFAAGALGRRLFELGRRRAVWRVLTLVLFLASLAPILYLIATYLVGG